jgi:O-acetyl-ADP-ribose deacetylase (regulator of RNase III)
MIEVRLGELENVPSAGIVRPVTAEWTAVTAAMRRVEAAAGEEIERQCRAMGELPVGSAIVTSAGGLPAELMIHVVVRSASEPVSAGGVARALSNGLRRADEWGIESLTMPPLGVGAGNMDAESAADVMVPILKEWLRTDRQPRRIVVVVESEYEREAFERATGPDGVRDGGVIGLPTLDP